MRRTTGARLLRLQVRAGPTVIFRSTRFTITEQSRLLMVVADNVGPAGSLPVKLLVFGGGQRRSRATCSATPRSGGAAFANTSSDAGPLDLIVGKDTGDVFAPSVVYGGAVAYEPCQSATVQLHRNAGGQSGHVQLREHGDDSAGRSSRIMRREMLETCGGSCLPMTAAACRPRRASASSHGRQRGTPGARYLPRPRGVGARSRRERTPPTPERPGPGLPGASAPG